MHEHVSNGHALFLAQWFVKHELGIDDAQVAANAAAHKQLRHELAMRDYLAQGMSREDAAARVERDERRARAYEEEIRMEDGYERGA